MVRWVWPALAIFVADFNQSKKLPAKQLTVRISLIIKRWLKN
jgi:hypothetical protein